MTIVAKLLNSNGLNEINLNTNGKASSINIPARDTGLGSAVNGGELLFLALATCYVNDVYREAKKQAIEISKVEVEVSGEFRAEGEGAFGITYSACVTANATKDVILQLMHHIDKIAEIHNTLRSSTDVILLKASAIPM